MHVQTSVSGILKGELQFLSLHTAALIGNVKTIAFVYKIPYLRT